MSDINRFRPRRPKPKVQNTLHSSQYNLTNASSPNENVVDVDYYGRTQSVPIQPQGFHPHRTKSTGNLASGSRYHRVQKDITSATPATKNRPNTTPQPVRMAPNRTRSMVNVVDVDYYGRTQSVSLQPQGFHPHRTKSTGNQASGSRNRRVQKDIISATPEIKNRPNTTPQPNNTMPAGQKRHNVVNPNRLSRKDPASINTTNNYQRFQNNNNVPRSHNNRNNYGAGNQPYFGFKRLEELVSKDPEEALVIFVNNIEQIQKLLNGNDILPDMIVLMFELLANIIKSVFAQSVADLLLAITEDNFFRPVKLYIMQLPLEDVKEQARGRRFWNAPEQFFLNVALTFDSMLEVIPKTAMDIVAGMIKAIDFTIKNIIAAQSVEISESVFEAYGQLQSKLDQLNAKEEKKKQLKAVGARIEEEEQPPPDDFHDIEIYPTVLEVTTHARSYLRKNIIKGSYQDVHHYLDVQYRLLREDFVAPLRDGICEYLEMEKQANRNLMKFSNIKVYKDVRCVGVAPNERQVGFIVQAFNPKSIKNLENSRQFMFGSLMCLTIDNFKSIIFGKIIDRDKKYLRRGQLVLGFDVGFQLNTNDKYIMAECTVYFEPYYHVLTAIKEMSEKRFPFKEYLVDVCTESEVPAYRKHHAIGELQNAKKELNPSQYEAYHAALTSKFCIVQGPPGTGKTYLALKVARTLLKERAIWDSGPMLVVCFTNHALDQFLEGLLEATTSLVRVGGQSKNEALNDFNLRSLRVQKVPAAYFKEMRLRKSKAQVYARQLGVQGGILRTINEYASIVNFSAFKKEAIDPDYARSWFQTASDEELLAWLLYQPNNSNGDLLTEVTKMAADLKIQQNQSELDVEGDEEEDADNPFTREQAQNQLDLGFDGDVHITYESSPTDLLNLKNIKADMMKTELTLQAMANSGMQNTLEYFDATQRGMKQKIDYDYVNQMLLMIQDQPDSKPLQVDYQNPSNMSPNDRWLLYNTWLMRYKAVVMAQYLELDENYRKEYAKFSEVNDMLNLYKLKQVDVIGMTTTGAARMHKILQSLACPIVIVEEAAEVLEAHIITALSPACQHLILIGDHKQLKPSTADHYISTQYKLGVSLFERMVDNGLHCHTLNVQHRMRPEIANLVSPAVYPVLHNHESVTLYPKIRGVDSSLFFISHSNPEEEAGQSKENLFEAEYLIELGRYLVLNNYEPSKITILAAYAGQWFLLQKLKKKYAILHDMRVCVLDNYQGEENDIILLSLVRNNNDKNIGFLKLENRICVALSRAKYGMYIMGNMPLLCYKDDTIWRQVLKALLSHNAYGEYLTVRCSVHPDYVTELKKPSDFKKVPEGGCLQICAKLLVCGHHCSKVCHMTPHDDYKCNQPCQRVLCDFGHICPDICYVECDKCQVPKTSTLPCGHTVEIPCYLSPEEAKCTVLMPTKLPCGHQVNKPCHADTEKFPCIYPCEARVEPCGHQCTMRCHIQRDPNHEKYKCSKPCARTNQDCSMEDDFKHPCKKLCFEECDPCKITIQKRRSCDHFFKIPCHSDVEDVQCQKPCKRKLQCGHGCLNSCDKSCGSCKVMVRKTIAECGHVGLYECSQVLTKDNCKEKNCTALLTCGHLCPLPCGKDCSMAKCMVLVTTQLESPCSHVLNVPCHQRFENVITNELLAHCTAKCRSILDCGHKCKGTCGECAQGRFHVPCAEKCDKILFCGHECLTPCQENCKPCTLQCQYECEHSKCTKQCGAPCTQCTELCNRRCPHQRCGKKCGEICEVPPCKMACSKVLECGHSCIGFCGDICPPLCRLCNRRELPNLSYNSRYVYLPDCKHVVESTVLDEWIQEDETMALKMPTCPTCHAIINVLRVRDYIKKAHKHLQVIKHEYFGHPKELKELTYKLKSDIAKEKAIYSTMIDNVCSPMFIYLEEKLNTTGKNNRRQDNSKAQLESLSERFNIFKSCAKFYYSYTGNYAPAKELMGNYLRFLFSKLAAVDVIINKKQIEEFQLEIQRFYRISQLAQAWSLNHHADKTNSYYIGCFKKVVTFVKYNKQQDATVEINMKYLHKMFDTKI